MGGYEEDGLGCPTVPVGFERPHGPDPMGATGQGEGKSLPVPEGAVERADKPDVLVRGTMPYSGPAEDCSASSQWVALTRGRT